MWIVVGMLYTFIQPGVMQLHLVKEDETPQQCWMEAKAIMGDSISPDHMACIPQFKPIEEGQKVTQLQGILT